MQLHFLPEKNVAPTVTGDDLVLLDQVVRVVALQQILIGSGR
jgi:hypothetical protein